MKNKKNNVIKNLFAIKKYVELFKEFLEINNLTEKFDLFIKERNINYEKDIKNFNNAID